MTTSLLTNRLVEAARSGDREALHRVYADTIDDVNAFVSRRVQPGSVGDLVADTYVRAFSSLDRYQETGAPFMAWLITIARNVIYNDSAKRARRRRLQPHLADQRTAIPVDERIEEREDRRLILEGLENLCDSDRELLELRFIDGHSTIEVAHILEMSAGAVRTASYRALNALRTDFLARGGALT